MHGEQAQYTNDDWLITKSIDLSGTVPSDRGVPLKGYPEKLKSYVYTYTSPGTYVVSFHGKNTTIHGSKDAVRELTITVVE
jgi:hypothetical protein